MRLTFGQRHILVSDKACGDRVIGAFPYAKRAHLLPVLIELNGVVRLVSVIEQLLRFARTGRIGSRPENDRKQAPRAAFGRRNQAVSRGLGKSGFHTIDVRIAPQQPVAIRLRDVVVAVFLERVQRVVLREIPDDRRGDSRQIDCSRHLLRRRQAGCIDETRVLHPQAVPGNDLDQRRQPVVVKRALAALALVEVAHVEHAL